MVLSLALSSLAHDFYVIVQDGFKLQLSQSHCSQRKNSSLPSRTFPGTSAYYFFHTKFLDRILSHGHIKLQGSREIQSSSGQRENSNDSKKGEQILGESPFATKGFYICSVS